MHTTSTIDSQGFDWSKVPRPMTMAAIEAEELRQGIVRPHNEPTKWIVRCKGANDPFLYIDARGYWTNDLAKADRMDYFHAKERCEHRRGGGFGPPCDAQFVREADATR